MHTEARGYSAPLGALCQVCRGRTPPAESRAEATPRNKRANSLPVIAQELLAMTGGAPQPFFCSDPQGGINSLLSRINSLLARIEFPVPSYREFIS